MTKPKKWYLDHENRGIISKYDSTTAISKPNAGQSLGYVESVTIYDPPSQESKGKFPKDKALKVRKQGHSQTLNYICIILVHVVGYLRCEVRPRSHLHWQTRS